MDMNEILLVIQFNDIFPEKHSDAQIWHENHNTQT